MNISWRRFLVIGCCFLAVFSMILGCRGFGGGGSDDGVSPVSSENSLPPVALSEVEDAIAKEAAKDPETSWKPEITPIINELDLSKANSLLGSNKTESLTNADIESLVKSDFSKIIEVSENDVIDPDQLFSMDSSGINDESDSVLFSRRASLRKSFYLPTSINWAEKDGKNWLTPIKNQGMHGTCVAFATTAALEANFKIARNDLNPGFDLSEAYLWFYGTGKFPGASGERPTNPSPGGWYAFRALSFLLPRNGYTVLESAAPYSYLNLFPEFGQVPEDCEKFSANGIFILKSPTAMKLALQKGPIYGQMKTNFYTLFYGKDSGIYSYIPIYDSNGDERNYPDTPEYPPLPPGSHAITVVGYDDGQGCWICKNSWGLGWGESGFFRARYGKGITEDYAFLMSVSVFITEKSPAPGQTDISANHVVEIGFGEDMRAETVAPENFKLEKLPESVPVNFTTEYIATSRTVKIVPEQPFEKASAYRVTAKATVKSADGDTLRGDESWVFFTTGYVNEAPPRVDFARKPDVLTGSNQAVFEFSGYRIETFKYRLDGSEWSNEMEIDKRLEIKGLSDGTHTIEAIGKAGSLWQDAADASVFSWQINTTPCFAHFSYGPASITQDTSPSFLLQADDLAAIKLNLDNTGWTGWLSVLLNQKQFSYVAVDKPGNHSLLAIGRNSLGVEQPIESASRWEWVYDPAISLNAEILSQPSLKSVDNAPVFEIGGNGIVSYKYRIDSDSGYSSEKNVSEKILSGELLAGVHRIDVLGKTDKGVWQPEDKPTSYSWTQLLVGTITASIESPTLVNPVTVKVTFNEKISGFDLSDLKIVNGAAGNLQVVEDGRVFQLDIVPVRFGEIRASLSENSVVGISGTNNSDSGEFRLIYGQLAPSVSISTSFSGPTREAVFPVYLYFDREIANLEKSVFQITNGSVDMVQRYSEDFYLAYIRATGDGEIIISLPAGSFADINGNYNSEDFKFVVVRDTSRPGAVLSTSISSPTNSAKISLSILFSETVKDFDLADLTVTNGTVSNLKILADEKSFSCEISLAVDGECTVILPENSASDLAGNKNTVSNKIGIMIDRARPVATITSQSPNPTNQSPILFKIEFNKAVSGLESADIAVTNGTAANLQMVSDNKVFTIEVVPQSNGAVLLALSENAAADAAGNGNEAASTDGITYDRSSASVVLTSSLTSSSNLEVLPVKVEFSKNMNGFALTHLALANGQAENLREITAGRVFEFDIRPQADGQVTINLPADQVADVLGNLNAAAEELVLLSDRTAPSVSLSTSAGNPTNKNPVTVNISFNEPVSGLEAADFSVINGSVTDLQTVEDGKIYTIRLTPAANGQCTVAFAAGKVSDTAGNGNTAATLFNISYDGERPTAVISCSAAEPTDQIPVVFAVEFSKFVNGFELADLQTENGNVTDLQTIEEGKKFRVEVIPLRNGLVKLLLPENVVSDAVTNGNQVAQHEVNFYKEMIGPIANIATPIARVNFPNIPFTVEFDTEVSDFSIDKLVVTNGVIESFAETVSKRVWNISVKLSSDGPVTVKLPAGSVKDTLDNPNTLAAESEAFYDLSRPAVAFSLSDTSLNPNLPLVLTITFNEPVRTFYSTDLSFSGGINVQNFIEVEPGRVFSLEVLPRSNSVWTCSLPAGEVYDIAGNSNNASPVTSFSIGNIDPEAIISAGPSPTNSDPIEFSVEFERFVEGLELGDFQVENGVAEFLSPDLSGEPPASPLEIKKWKISVVPSENGPVTLTLPAGAATDVAGNGNSAVSHTVVFEKLIPLPLLSLVNPGPSKVAIIPVRVSFNCEVENFDAADLAVTNAEIESLIPLAEPNTWELSLRAVENGDVRVKIPAGSVANMIGNVNPSDVELAVVFDDIRPSGVLNLEGNALTNQNQVYLAVNFSEAIKDFEISDLQVSNGQASDLQTIEEGKIYRVTITPFADGQCSVSVPADKLNDIAGNSNIAIAEVSFIFDRARPSAQITCESPNPTNQSPILFKIEFNKVISGLEPADFAVDNGTAANLQMVSDNKVFTVEVAPQGIGAVSLALAENMAGDAAGNGNEAAVEAGVAYDNASPNVSLTSSVISPTSQAQVTVKMVFDKAVSGFAVSDLVIVNGTAGEIPVEASSSSTQIGQPIGIGAPVCFREIVPGYEWEVDVTPIADGEVKIKIPEGAAADSLGNLNSASADYVFVSDRNLPVANFSSAETGLSNKGNFPVTISFSEAINGFELSDIISTNCSLDSLQVIQAGQSWSFNVAVQGDGLISLELNAGSVFDAAGNGNTTAEIYSLTIDRQSPSVSISSTVAGPTGENSIPLQIVFSEPVTGFSASDVQVTGGSISNLQTSDNGMTWTAELAPVSDGESRVNLAAGVASDSAGNLNSAADEFAIIFDRAKPAVSLSCAATDPMNANQLNFQVSFSETVVNFAAESFTLENAEVGEIDVLEAGKVWSVTLIPLNPGLISVSIDSDKVSDAAGNLNEQSETITRIYDPAPPVIQRVYSTSADGYKIAGAEILLFVEFSENLLLNTDAGIPSIRLETGSTDRSAAFEGFENQKTLKFRYVVVAGDESPDLDYQSISAFELNGSLLTDNAGNNASLQLPAPGSSASLAGNAAIVVDTMPPTAILGALPAAVSNATSVSVQVSGSGLSHFIWRLNDGAWSSEQTSASGINLADISAGNNRLEVIGRDLAGNWQSEETATVYTWFVDSMAPTAPVLPEMEIIPGNLNGHGNNYDQINSALAANFSDFRVALANNSEGAETASLTIRLSDNEGNSVLCSGIDCLAGSETQSYGGFSDDAISGFIDGNILIEAWLEDRAGNFSAIASRTLERALDARPLNVSMRILNPGAISAVAPVQVEVKFTEPVDQNYLTFLGSNLTVENGYRSHEPVWLDGRTFTIECSVADSYGGSGGTTDGAIRLILADGATHGLSFAANPCPYTVFRIPVFRQASIYAISGISGVNSPIQIAVDSTGRLYAASGKSVMVFTGDNGSWNGNVFAGDQVESGYIDAVGADARFNEIKAIAFDQADNLYVVDAHGTFIDDGMTPPDGYAYLRKISPTGEVTTIFEGNNANGSSVLGVANSMVVSQSGDVYVSLFTSVGKISGGNLEIIAGSVPEYGSNDGPGPQARFSYLQGICLDSQGNVFVSDTMNHTIRKIATDGMVTTFAGQTGMAGNTESWNGETGLLSMPAGLSCDSGGNLMVGCTDGIRRITPQGEIINIHTFSDPDNRISSVIYSPEKCFLVRSYGYYQVDGYGSSGQIYEVSLDWQR